MRMLRRLGAAGVGLVLVLGAAACEWPDGTRFVDKVFADVDITRDLVYRQTTTHDGQPIDLKLDIYEPRGDTRSERPVVMWMFGGGWTSGDKEQLAAYATDSAQRGYVGITIDYRIRPNDPNFDLQAAAMDAYDDAVGAVDWLKSHAADHGLDAHAIVAGGVSAGAINAMNLLYLPPDRGPATSPIAGGVAISGVGFTTPMAGDPPSIMHHGTADNIVPYESGKKTCDDAIAAGEVCRWLPYEGGDHFIVISHAAEIMETSAHLIFEDVLWPLGYRVEGASAQAA